MVTIEWRTKFFVLRELRKKYRWGMGIDGQGALARNDEDNLKAEKNRAVIPFIFQPSKRQIAQYLPCWSVGQCHH